MPQTRFQLVTAGFTQAYDRYRQGSELFPIGRPGNPVVDFHQAGLYRPCGEGEGYTKANDEAPHAFCELSDEEAAALIPLGERRQLERSGQEVTALRTEVGPDAADTQTSAPGKATVGAAATFSLDSEED